MSFCLQERQKDKAFTLTVFCRLQIFLWIHNCGKIKVFIMIISISVGLLEIVFLTTLKD